MAGIVVIWCNSRMTIHASYLLQVSNVCDVLIQCNLMEEDEEEERDWFLGFFLIYVLLLVNRRLCFIILGCNDTVPDTICCASYATRTKRIDTFCTATPSVNFPSYFDRNVTFRFRRRELLTSIFRPFLFFPRYSCTVVHPSFRSVRFHSVIFRAVRSFFV